MKKFTKAALALSAAILMAFGFASCAEEDDPFNLIQGGPNNFSVDHLNETSSVIRGYKGTHFRHTGGTVRIKQDATVKDTGVMGFIWEKQSSKSGVKDAVDFYVLGIKYGYSDKPNDVSYYISQYINVVDIQADNFGATTVNSFDTSDNKPQEIARQNWTKLDKYTVTNNEVDIVVDVVQDDTTGTYNVNFYKGSEYNDKADTQTATPVATFNGLPADHEDDSNLKVIQHDLAIYANVQPNPKHLKGTWEFLKDYNYTIVEED